jgi:hypothetical protein
VDLDPGFQQKKLKKKIQLKFPIFLFFDKKIEIYLSLDVHKGRPSYRRRLQPPKANIQNFKR